MKNRHLSAQARFIGLKTVIFVLFLIATTANAESLTLKDCLERAERNNPDLKTAAWDIGIAEDNVSQVSSAYYPQIDVNVGYTAQQAAQAAMIEGIKAKTQQPDFAFAGLYLNHTIYDFGRRKARQQRARLTAGSTADMFEARRKDVSLKIIETYFGILEINQLIMAAQEEVKQLEQHRSVAQSLFDEGVVTRNDVLQADVRLASAGQKLLATVNSRENAWLQLNYLTGEKPAFRADLDQNSEFASQRQKPANEKEALAKRPEIKALRKGVEAGEADLQESKSNFYPEIYSRLSFDYAQNDKVSEQTIMAATIGIKVNLFDGFSSTSTRQRAVHALQKNRDSLRQAETQVQLEIATAENDARVARERIDVTRTAIQQSEENQRINLERYREHVGTATESLDAQTLLTQTKTDYYQAIYDYKVAIARLKRAMGEL